MKQRAVGLITAGIVAGWGTAHAYEISDQFAIGGVLAGAGQCQSLSDDAADDECRAGVPFQVEMSFTPDERNEVFAKLGFAAGNALGEVSPWTLSAWAADLEDDVKDINGRNRDYLLTSWYKHTIPGASGDFGVSLGILDSTDYLDANEYANDEFAQFSNEVFVNDPIYNLASYDGGVALEWGGGAWSVNGMAMNIGSNDDGSSYDFWGAQFGFHTDAGNYRFVLTGTSSDFLNPAGTSSESLFSYGFSLDQAFSDNLGGFLRLGWQDEDAAVDYKASYSGGVNFGVREADTIGVGFAYLDGGNTGLDNTQVLEAYYAFTVNDYFALTADVQYMKDEYVVDPDVKGWIFGLRALAEF